MAPGASKNEDIEILRAIAVLFVLYHHARDILFPMTADFADRIAFGPAGVDLFFVISGFVIGRSLLPRLQAAAGPRERWSETLAFWTRRAFRLLPTAWLWLALILVVTGAFAFTNPDLNFNTNVGASLAGVFYYANFRFADAFQNYSYGASFQYWSLSLEEQFYLLFPLAVLLGRRWLIWVILAAIAFDQLREPTRYAIITRYTGLLLGVLIAIWNEKRSYQKLRALALKATPFALVSCVVALALIPLLATGPREQFSNGLVALAGAVAVLIASFNANLLTPRGVIRNLGLWCGARSYALYVIHVPLFLIAAELGTRAGSFQQPASLTHAIFGVLAPIALVIVLADLNFRLVEQPLRQFGAKLSTRIAKGRTQAALAETG